MHTGKPIAERLGDLHAHMQAHDTAAETATREAKEALLAKIAERDTMVTRERQADDGGGDS